THAPDGTAQTHVAPVWKRAIFVVSVLDRRRPPVKKPHAEVALFLSRRAFVPEGKAPLAKPAVAPDQPPLPGSRPDMQLDLPMRAEILGVSELPAQPLHKRFDERLSPVRREQRGACGQSPVRHWRRDE